MLYQPEHVLLIAVGLALVLPAPGRWNPLGLARRAAPALARDLPSTGRWAAPAGVLVLALIAAPAAGIAWVVTDALPSACRFVSLDAPPIAATALAGLMLRFTFELAPLWTSAGRRERGASVKPDDLTWRKAVELAAPLLLFAFLGLYAPIVYRVAVEVARGFDARDARATPASPALWVTYVPAAPVQRVVLLFALLASRGRGLERHRVGSAAALGTIALALLITIW